MNNPTPPKPRKPDRFPYATIKAQVLAVDDDENPTRLEFNGRAFVRSLSGSSLWLPSSRRVSHEATVSQFKRIAMQNRFSAEERAYIVMQICEGNEARALELMPFLILAKKFRLSRGKVLEILRKVEFDTGKAIDLLTHPQDESEEPA